METRLIRTIWSALFKYRLLLTACFAGIGIPSIAQQRIDLPYAINLLEQQNPELIQANLTRLLAVQDVIDAQNAFIPQVNFGASHNYNMGLVFDQIAGQLVTGNQWSNTANANVNVGATVFQGFARLNALRMSKLYLESGEISIMVQKKALVLQLMGHYFDAVASLELQHAGEKQARLTEEQLQQTRVELEVGSKTLVDVSLLESQLAADELRVLNSRNEYDNQILSIKEMLGIPFDDSITLELPALDAAISPERYADTLADNIELRLARVGIAQAELDLRAKRNSRYPTISFSGGYGTNYSSLRRDFLTGGYMPFAEQIDQNRSLYIGVSLNVPLLNGFRVRSDISRAHIQIRQRNNELDRTRVQQQKIWLVAKQEYRRTLAELKVQNQQVVSTRTSYEAMKQRYELGVSTAMDMARTSLEHNIAELNLIRTRYTMLYHQELLKVLMTY